MLRLDQLRGIADGGKPVERVLSVLQGVKRVRTGWETACPGCDRDRGLIVREEPVLEYCVPIAWCCSGCPDEVVRAALTERLKRPEDVKAAPTEAPAPVPATVPLLGLTEAALVLGCHRRTVRAYVRAGLLRGRLVAGRWKIRREDLEAFIEGHTQEEAERAT